MPGRWASPSPNGRAMQSDEDDRDLRANVWTQGIHSPKEIRDNRSIASAMNHLYTKPAGISFLLHIALLCLALFVAGRVAPPPPSPDPIDVEFEPSKLVSMGSGMLHFTSGTPPPAGPKKAAKPKVRMAANKPVPKPSEPPPARAPANIDQPPPPLPGEITEASVAVPAPGDKATEGGGAGTGTGGISGGGGKGGTGTGTGTSGEGEGSGGGDYGGSGFRSGALPGYPASARRAGREGVVTVRVLVGTDGKPMSVTVRVTSGHEDFDAAALTAVKKWLFSPAHRGKEPVASFHDVRIRFRLDEAR